MSIIIYHRAKNWLWERRGWIKLTVVALAIVFLSFGIGFVMGRGSNPTSIIIEKNSP